MAKQSTSTTTTSAPLPVPAEVLKLIERFNEQADSYRAGKYNETQIRREFIDPLLKALGWDVDNSQGYAEAYKDVIHEDAIKVGGSTKAPDYCFRIGGTRKFFVEAKKPSIDIKGDPNSAYQLRRYAWSAKLPLSVLTDFEELAVYDCRIKPSPNDKASKARTLYFKYTELPDRWNELASIFSRDAILKGSFDKYAESSKKKRGTAEVDDAFLEEIEHWRDILARNIALRNKDLSQRELNFSVQRTIDRIIFLRICEDRGIEEYATLQSLTNGKQVYPRLFERFQRADERYNSGLFHFSNEKSRPESPDDLTPNLAIDDKPLKDILNRLYYPDCPYEFSVLPSDILGQVYEQFLGKVIRLTSNHQAVIEEKPEVRKAGGVYYTPTYIVDYIVENTVGNLVEGKTPIEVGALTAKFQPSKARDASPLSVLDPACGSGSFLIGAYDFLLKWYQKWYTDDGTDKHTGGKNPRLFQHASGEFRLTITERKRILLAHIYGVDIDSQAVETTKLSLLLKVLEGESDETIGANLRLFHERALPDLADNIKCGNSLIGPNFYDHVQMDMFDEEERMRINVFEWQTEFKDIMKGGGFDAVIGNPPYGAQLTESIRHFLRTEFTCGSTDTAALFVELANATLSAKGRTGFIIPKPYCYASNWRLLRERFLGELEAITDCGRVWKAVKLEQVIVLYNNAINSRFYQSHVRDVFSIRRLGDIDRDTIEQFGFLVNGVGPSDISIAKTMLSVDSTLGHLCVNRRGAPLQKLVTNDGDHITLGGKHIGRWLVRPDDMRRCNQSDFDDEKAFINQQSVLVQNIVAHVANPIPHIKVIATPSNKAICANSVILDTINQLTCSEGVDPQFICGILNSKPVNWYIYRFIFANAIRTMHFDAVTVDRLPIPAPASLPEGVLATIIDGANRLMKLMTQKPNTSHETTHQQRELIQIGKNLDRAVALAYGLTDTDIDYILKQMP